MRSFYNKPITNGLSDLSEAIENSMNDLLDSMCDINPLKGGNFQGWNFTEEDSGNVLTLDLPGIDKSTLIVEAQTNTIKVYAERKGKKIEKKFVWKYEIDEIKAVYADGVLTITFTKVEPRKVKIEGLDS